MSNIEFLLVLFLFNTFLLIGVVSRSIRKKSPRSLLKLFFLPPLMSIVFAMSIQSFFEISEMSNRQVLANFLFITWCIKSFNSYKSLKVILLDEFLNSARLLINKKKYISLLSLVIKISIFQIICFSSIFSLNYLSGYSILNFIDLVGLFLCFVGLTLELLSEKEIKENLFINKKVISSGPWSYVRHPNLSGIVIFFSGLQILALGAVGSEWSIVGLIFLIYVVNVKLVPEIEDKLLSKYPEYEYHIDDLPKLFPLKKR